MPDESRPPSTAQAAPYAIDGRAFVTERSPDDSESMFLELLPSGFVPRAKVPGTILGVARIR